MSLQSDEANGRSQARSRRTKRGALHPSESVHSLKVLPLHFPSIGVAATLLAEAIYREGLRFVTAGANPIGIQRGIQKAVDAAVEHLARITKKVKDNPHCRLSPVFGRRVWR